MTDEVTVFLTVDEANAVKTVLGQCFLGFDMKDHDIYYALEAALRDFGGCAPFNFDRSFVLRPPEHTPQTPQDHAAAIIATIDRVTNGSTVTIRGIDFGDITTSNSAIVRDIKA